MAVSECGSQVFADAAAVRAADVIANHTDQVHKPPRGKSAKTDRAVRA